MISSVYDLSGCRYAAEWKCAYSISGQDKDHLAVCRKEESIQTSIGVNTVRCDHMPAGGTAFRSTPNKQVLAREFAYYDLTIKINMFSCHHPTLRDESWMQYI